MKASIKAKELDGGRTILIDNEGQPQTVQIMTRQASTSPTRLKAILVVKADFDGEQGVIPMPFAQAQVGNGFTTEFRLEMC